VHSISEVACLNDAQQVTANGWYLTLSPTLRDVMLLKAFCSYVPLRVVGI
jgi:hypothetical protein